MLILITEGFLRVLKYQTVIIFLKKFQCLTTQNN